MRGVAEQVPRSGALVGCSVSPVAQSAVAQGQAAASDAVVEVLSHQYQCRNAFVQLLLPVSADPGPVGLAWGAVGWKVFESGSDVGERNANGLTDGDEGDATQYVWCVYTVAMGITLTGHQIVAFIEAQRRGAHTRSRGNF